MADIAATPIKKGFDGTLLQDIAFCEKKRKGFAEFSLNSMAKVHSRIIFNLCCDLKI